MPKLINMIKILTLVPLLLVFFSLSLQGGAIDLIHPGDPEAEESQHTAGHVKGNDGGYYMMVNAHSTSPLHFQDTTYPIKFQDPEPEYSDGFIVRFTDDMEVDWIKRTEHDMSFFRTKNKILSNDLVPAPEGGVFYRTAEGNEARITHLNKNGEIEWQWDTQPEEQGSPFFSGMVFTYHDGTIHVIYAHPEDTLHFEDDKITYDNPEVESDGIVHVKLSTEGELIEAKNIGHTFKGPECEEKGPIYLHGLEHTGGDELVLVGRGGTRDGIGLDFFEERVTSCYKQGFYLNWDPGKEEVNALKPIEAYQRSQTFVVDVVTTEDQSIYITGAVRDDGVIEGDSLEQGGYIAAFDNKMNFQWVTQPDNKDLFGVDIYHRDNNPLMLISLDRSGKLLSEPILSDGFTISKISREGDLLYSYSPDVLHADALAITEGPGDYPVLTGHSYGGITMAGVEEAWSGWDFFYGKTCNFSLFANQGIQIENGRDTFPSDESVTLSIEDREDQVNYRWYHEDVPISSSDNPGATDPEITVEDEGTYHVWMEDDQYPNKCFHETEPVELVHGTPKGDEDDDNGDDDDTFLSEANENPGELLVSPNPAKEEVRFAFEDEHNEIRQVLITDVSGRVAHEKAFSRGLTEYKAPLKSLNPGVYLYRIKNVHGSNYQGKLIVK